MTAATRATKISKDVAMARFVETTIGLLEKLPIAGVSDRLIAESAGINRASLYRYFNTRHELFDIVLDNLVERYLAELQAATAPYMPDVKNSIMDVGTLVQSFSISSKVFDIGNYLAAENYRSETLTANISKIFEMLTKRLYEAGVAPRMARALALQAIGLGFGRPNASSIIPLQPDDVADVFQLMVNSIKNHAEVTAKFGWAEAESDSQ